MVRTDADFELGQHFAADLVLWQHTAYRVTNHLLRLSRHSVSDRLGSQAGVTSVPGVLTLFAFVARVMKLLTVCKDNEIAGVFIGCVGWLVLAHQDSRNVGRDTSNGFVFTIDDPPLLFERVVFLCVV